MLRFLSCATLLVSALGFAQTPPPRPAPGFHGVDLNALPNSPVPVDALEVVIGPAQSVSTAEERAAAINLLTKARALSNVRSRPYHLKTSFRSMGSLPSDGAWTLDDISSDARIYRWTAQGPGYSAVNLYTDTTQGVMYSDQPTASIPIRLAQARAAIFFSFGGVSPNSGLRTATGVLDGKVQSCVLRSIGPQSQSMTGSRSWLEDEYCVDQATGLLTVYSPQPGLYVHYSYSTAPNFHGVFVATGFEIEQAGRTILEAKTDSVTDPPDAKDPMFSNAGLTAAGVGQGMTASRNVDMMPPTACFARGNPDACAGTPTVQVVGLHGMISPEGQLATPRSRRRAYPNLYSEPATRPTMLLREGYQVAWHNPENLTPQSQEAFVTLRMFQAFMLGLASYPGTEALYGQSLSIADKVPAMTCGAPRR